MSGNSFKNKDLASKAGKIGGKHKKTLQWEALGEFITQAGAAKAMKILNKLPDDQYLDQYNKLLNYFKPRMSHVVEEGTREQVGPVEVKIIKPDAEGTT